MAVTTIRGGRQIADATIPYIDIQNVTANTVLCNNTTGATSIQEVALSTNTLLGRGSTGNIAAITAGTGLSFSGTVLNASGTIGGSTGSTDNAILRADGTGGVTLQNSAVTIDDSGNLTVGTTSIAGSTRSFTAEGSAANIDFRIVPKGTGRAYLYSSDLQSYVYASNSAIVLSSTNTSASLEIAINGTSSTQSRFTFTGGSEFTLQRITTDTASVSNTLRLLQYSTGTPAAGFGSSIDFVLPTSSTITQILSNLVVDIQTLGSNGVVDFSVKLRYTGGTNLERFRVKGTGQIRFNNYTSSSSFTGTAVGYLAFDSSGNILSVAVPSGTIGGSTGSVDNAILRADGTGGTTVQNSNVIIDDSANITLGNNALAGASRTITASGSATRVDVALVPKGANAYSLLYSADNLSYLFATDNNVAGYAKGASEAVIVLQAFNTTTNALADITLNSNNFIVLRRIVTTTNTVNEVLRLQLESTGTAAAGFGATIQYVLPTSASTSAVLASETIDIQTFGSTGLVDYYLKLRDTSGFTTEKLRVKGAGQLKLNAYTSSTSFTGTAAGYLAFDSSGNILTVAVPSSGGITTLNTLTATTQTFANDTNVTITSATSTHTLGWSGQLAVSRGGTGVSSVTTSPTASAFAGWDANRNISADNFIEGYATTATAAGTTTLTVDSTYFQYFTGTTTQTVTLPVVTTLVNGFQFQIVNQSTGIVTVQTSGANTIMAMGNNTVLTVTCVNTAGGTGTASWTWTYNAQRTVSVTTAGATLTPNITIGDVFTITAQDVALAVANPTGTPVNGQRMIIRIKDNGTLRSITWSGSQYRASSDLSLPTTTIASRTQYLGFIWNSTDSRWDLLARLDNFA